MTSVAPPPMVKRAEWGAEPTEVTKKYAIADLPLYYIYVSLKSQLDPCKTKEECCKVLKEAQVKYKKQSIGDIPYSFVISEDGTIFEGRGWEYKPQKAIEMEPKDFDPRAYDIAYFGDWSGVGQELPDAAFKSMWNLIQYGIKRKYLIEEFDLEPFREDVFVPTFYPGEKYFKEHAKEIRVETPMEVVPAKPPEEEGKEGKEGKEGAAEGAEGPEGMEGMEGAFQGNPNVKWDFSGF